MFWLLQWCYYLLYGCYRQLGISFYCCCVRSQVVAGCERGTLRVSWWLILSFHNSSIILSSLCLLFFLSTHSLIHLITHSLTHSLTNFLKLWYTTVSLCVVFPQNVEEESNSTYSVNRKTAKNGLVAKLSWMSSKLYWSAQNNDSWISQPQICLARTHLTVVTV